MCLLFRSSGKPALGAAASFRQGKCWTRYGAYGVELRGAGTDESPFVYRKLQEVLDAHAGTIEVLHVLKPIGVCMAGADEFDPYKD